MVCASPLDAPAPKTRLVVLKRRLREIGGTVEAVYFYEVQRGHEAVVGYRISWVRLAEFGHTIHESDWSLDEKAEANSEYLKLCGKAALMA